MLEHNFSVVLTNLKMVEIRYVFLFGVILLTGNFAKHSNIGSGKIIGGNNVTIENFPHQAYLLISIIEDGAQKYQQCGGSVISPYFILSAAHCFLGATNISARIGSANATSGGTVYHSAYYKIHHKYNTVTKDYDIGFMKTLKRMKLDGVTTKAVTLIEAESIVPAGSSVTVSGWGRIAPEGPLSPTLKAAELTTISNEECNEIHGNISLRQLCAGVKDGSEDFCKGDSGGPAVLTKSKIQVGIVSASYACAKAGSPGILVNVTDLRNWIYRYTSV